MTKQSFFAAAFAVTFWCTLIAAIAGVRAGGLAILACVTVTSFCFGMEYLGRRVGAAFTAGIVAALAMCVVAGFSVGPLAGMASLAVLAALGVLASAVAWVARRRGHTWALRAVSVPTVVVVLPVVAGPISPQAFAIIGLVVCTAVWVVPAILGPVLDRTSRASAPAVK